MSNKISKSAKEEIIFDSERDNNGKGIPINKIIKILNKIGQKKDQTTRKI